MFTFLYTVQNLIKMLNLFPPVQESASLADRLIQYQLTRAQEAEETYALKNELSLTKQKHATAQKQLKEAEALLGDIKERVGFRLHGIMLISDVLLNA